MYEFLLMTKYVLFQSIGFFILAIAVVALLFIILYIISKKFNMARKIALPAIVLVLGIFLLFFSPQIFPKFLKYPFFLKTFGPADGPELPLKNIYTFFKNIKNFEKVDIAKDPADIPSSVVRNTPKEVNVEMEAKEVIGEMAPGIFFNYWTYNGQVPGPFIRARVGDKINLTLKNQIGRAHV